MTPSWPSPPRAGISRRATTAPHGEHLARARELAPRLSPPRRTALRGASTAIELYGARLRGDFDQVLSVARVVFESPWSGGVDPHVRAFIHANLGIAEFWSDQADAAADHLRQAAGLALDCGNDYVRFVADAYAAAVALRKGRVDEAADRAGTALALAERRGWTLLPPAAMAYMSLAVVHLWREDLQAAERLTERAVAAANKSRERLVGPAVALARARLRLARGDPLGALDRLRTASVEPCPRFLQVSTAILEAEAWLALGEPARGRELLATFDDAPDPWSPRLASTSPPGEPDSALREVTAFAAGAAEPVSPLTRTEGRAVEAIARDELRDPAGRSAPSRLLSTWPNLAATPTRSCATARPSARCSGAGSTMAPRTARSPASSSRRWRSDPLGRQRALEPAARAAERARARRPAFLPTMLSNTDIAAEMFVSVNTVKTHLKHVYRKLDVTDRRQAVQRARELRLLSPGLHGR